MSYEQYWFQEPELYWAYQVAYKNNLKLTQEMENEISWLRGLYVWKAFNTVQYNMNKRETDPLDYYFDKPIDFEAEQLKQTEDNRKLELENRIKAMLFSKKKILDKSKKEG